jgi:hypothetical protein
LWVSFFDRRLLAAPPLIERLRLLVDRRQLALDLGSPTAVCLTDGGVEARGAKPGAILPVAGKPRAEASD